MPDTLDWKSLSEQYGWAASLVKSDKGLLQLFKDASAHGYTAEQFTAKLQATDWFQKHTVAWMKATTEKAKHPVEWNAKVEQQTQAIIDASAQMGSEVSAKQARTIASNALMFGWDEHQIQNNLSSFVTEMKGTAHWAGQAGQNEMDIRKAMADNGIKMSHSSLQNWVKSIARGDRTVDDAKTWVRNQAELSFPAYKDQIKAGMDVRDIASAYTQSMADILELNPDSIDLHDKTIRNALSYKDAKGQPSQMSLTDFELGVRKDPRWRATANARQASAEMATQVLQDFGFAS